MSKSKPFHIPYGVLAIMIIVLCCSFAFKSDILAKREQCICRYVSDSAFTLNSEEGWSSLQTYLNTVGDSVEFEVVLSRMVQPQNDWTIFSMVGTIDSVYNPHLERQLIFSEPNRSWMVKIFPNGECYMRLLEGPYPTQQPAIIPLKTKYLL